jgi:hypothetical protein
MKECEGHTRSTYFQQIGGFGPFYEDWQAGSHEKNKATAEVNNLGPNPYDARNNKLITWESFCMYCGTMILPFWFPRRRILLRSYPCAENFCDFK